MPAKNIVFSMKPNGFHIFPIMRVDQQGEIFFPPFFFQNFKADPQFLSVDLHQLKIGQVGWIFKRTQC